MYVRVAYWAKCSVPILLKDGLVRVDRKLQLAHSDVYSPMQSPSFGNYLYFVTFIDDFSRHAWVYVLKANFEVFL